MILIISPPKKIINVAHNAGPVKNVYIFSCTPLLHMVSGVLDSKKSSLWFPSIDELMKLFNNIKIFL